MQIVVNHVTRMKGGSRICVAGIDAASSRHVRFYESDGQAIKHSVVADVRRRLRRGVCVYAMLGLARPILDEGAGEEVHWLMANGLCLEDRPVGDVP